MATDLTEAVIDAKIGELRALIRVANGTLKDIRDTKRDIDKAIRDFREQIDDRLAQMVKEGLEQFHGQIETATGEATQAVYDRFDLIAALCLGEDAISQREGKKPLDELLRRYIAKHGPVTP